jgi:tetratricopeptide (TPR) repeat protein
LWSHALVHGGDSSTAHLGLGSACYRQARLEEAAAHYVEAIRHDPGLAGAHHGMGAVRYFQGRSAEAAAEFDEAIRLDPSSAQSHSGLASIRARQGRYEEAIVRFDEAIRLDPDHAESHNDRAMILASCPEARYRDGREAVAAATRACELAGWDRPEYLDTLAAAYAEAGDFAAAIARQEQAIGLRPDGPRKDGYRSRLALYRAAKPFHAPASAPAPAAGSL